MPALDPAKQGSITPRYLLKIAKARLLELDALGLDPASEDYLRRRVEIMDLDRRGAELLELDQQPLSPAALKQDAWLNVAHVMATSGARTRLMAAKLIADRSDPVPHDDPDDPKKKARPIAIQVNLGVAIHGPGNGHADSGADARPELRPRRVEVHLGGDVRPVNGNGSVRHAG